VTSPLLTQLQRCREQTNFGGAKNFCPNSRKLARKNNPQEKVTSKKKLFMLFWAPFLLIVSRFCSDFQEFVKVFSDFTQISSDFAQIFTKSKLLEVR